MGLLDIFMRKPSPDSFADMVMKRAHVLSPQLSARYDDKAFQIHFDSPEGKPWTMNLHNAYRDALAASHAKRGAVIEHYLLSMTHGLADDSAEGIAANLMPVIRDTAMFDWMRLYARAAGDLSTDTGPLARTFTDNLSVALVLDSERATQTVGRGQLAIAGLDRDAAFRQAVDNLRDRTDPSGMSRQGGVWISTWNDIYDASRLLLTDMIHRLDVHGEPVAIIPSRNHLLVTGSLDAEGLERIATLAADVLEQDTRPLGDQFLLLRDGNWLPFETPLSPETARRLSLARYRRLDGAYGEQKKVLETIHEKEQTDRFVASYRAAEETHTGRIFSTAQWTRGVETLLPRGDQLLLFCDVRRELLTIDWEDAVAHIPQLAVPCADLCPPRFLLTDFPDDATYEVLKQKSLNVQPVPDD
ncbi:hypothetical protein [Luteibacter sp. ME-Dv--P-043b]|uniref:hypothetical protein n=1 Tax=unclassified Luteibacter TaxID=2620188 RepID=UPI002553F91F|nr:hypothetical protein [Luteibacter sp. ME-Dv--P-043b]